MTTDGVGTEGRSPLDPASAFKILGNETRLDILLALLDSRGHPLSFSELRKRVGIRDGSQFNYHLRKLEPTYVAHDGDGYHISIAGSEVITAIVAGTLTEQHAVPPFPVEGECFDCGGELLARYEDELMRIDCAECDLPHYLAFLPPGGLTGRTPEEALAASDSLLRAASFLCTEGICPGCTRRTRQSILGPEETLPVSVVGAEAAERLRECSGPSVFYECEGCGIWYYLTMGDTLVFEPVVVQFYRDHGLELSEIPSWTLPWSRPALAGKYAEIVSDDPFRVAVRFPLEHETLIVTLDEDLGIVTAERSGTSESSLRVTTG